MSKARSSPLRIVVGSGGVGKTTIAAALGVRAAEAGRRTLVMTFDPSERLKDTLGVGVEARDAEVRVPCNLPGELYASLLDARSTFDRLVARYAPDEAARRRILDNRFYDHLAGRLSGILEYMAVERLYEVARSARYECVILDTPPTSQALDFLEAPERIVSFLDSGALRVALKPWFDESGHLRPTSHLGFLGRGLEGWLDRIVGLGLLRDMAEFFQAFAPLYDGFRERAADVERLLRSDDATFVLVAGPGEERIPDTMFFARRLEEQGYRLSRVAINRIHPEFESESGGQAPGEDPAVDLLRWLGERDRRGVGQLRALLAGREVLALPLLPRAPIDVSGLAEFGSRLEQTTTGPVVSAGHVRDHRG